MSDSPSRAYEYVQDKRYVGELAEPTVIGRSSLDGQPPHTTLYLRILDERVREARFRTSGCGYLMAACGSLIELALDRSLDDCRTITERQIIEHLNGIPDTRRYCAALAIAALHDAINALTSRERQETQISGHSRPP
jgi:NifU-like protein involved in Fe-S cluster formation